MRSDVGVELKGVRSGVERRRGRGLKARAGRRDTPGEVLKDRRSSRERGRMGTSVLERALHMFTHMPVHPLSCSHRHFFMCTRDAISSRKSFSSVFSTVIGPTIHAKTTLQMVALSSKENLFVGNSLRNTLSPPGGMSDRMIPSVMSRCPSGSRPRI